MRLVRFAPGALGAAGMRRMQLSAPASVVDAAARPTAGHILALLDFCKGLAILGVMLVHAVHRGFGWQGVHLFIVLSGFTLACSDLKRGGAIDRRAWALRRANRILPAYWL